MQDIKSKILGTIERYPEKPALEIKDKVLNYKELGHTAASIAGNLNPNEDLVGILVHKDIGTYTGVLGIHWNGSGHVPIHPGFPIERTSKMIELSGIKTLLSPLTDDPYINEIKSAHPELTVLEIPTIDRDKKATPRLNTPEDIAYLLFTSGSTGVPKGVGINHKNVTAYINHIEKTYPLSTEDRCSQTFDLTFDLSIHDIFVTWSQGACLCPLTNSDLFFAGNFIKSKNITVWFSVPALANTISQMRMLTPGAFPNLRLSFFCGEALPLDLAEKWYQATNQNRLINLYGPTEATIAISEYEFTPQTKNESLNGIVPIGKVFTLQKFKVSEIGELLVSGSQIAPGYWNNSEKTNEVFIQIGGEIYYRTGDKVELKGDCIHYLTRLDNQVQINGHRVELFEIEAAIRENFDISTIVTIAIKNENGGDIIIGFINKSEEALIETIKENLGQHLPYYMQPERFIPIDSFPLNSNGKIDRNALKASLD